MASYWVVHQSLLDFVLNHSPVIVGHSSARIYGDEQRIKLRKVLGTENPLDFFTKHIASAAKVEELLGNFGCTD